MVIRLILKKTEKVRPTNKGGGVSEDQKDKPVPTAGNKLLFPQG